MGEGEKTNAELKFQEGDQPVINAADISLQAHGQVRFVEIENERNGKDRDDDHQPFVVLAHYGDHRKENLSGWEGQNLRRVADEPTAFSVGSYFCESLFCSRFAVKT